MINTSLKKKIKFFAAALISLIIICLLAGVLSLNRVNIAKNKAMIAVKIHDMFEELRILFEQTLMGPHDYIIHGNQEEKGIFQEDYKRLVAETDNLIRLIITQETQYDQEFAGALKKAENQLLGIEKRLPEFEMKANDIFGLGFPMEWHKVGFYMEEMDFFVRELGTALEKEGAMLLELSDKAIDQIHRFHVRTMILFIIFGATAVFLGIILSNYLMRSITGPVDNLILATRKIKKGNLTIRAKVVSNDEIGELAGSFNEMLNELVDAQERISTVLHSSGDAICVIDKDYKILQINRQMERFTNISSAEAIGGKCYDFFSGKLCHTEGCTLKRILKDEKWIEIETIKETKDGKRIPVELVATPLKKRDKILGVIESFRDIADRKQAQKRLNSSLKEKEVLLKEIHHRVKNNLQIISSLLYLQSKNIKDETISEIFKESQNRVKSMSLIHEKLYQSKDLARIDFAEYTQDLAKYLLSTYGTNANHIELKTDIDKVHLDIDSAIPCGLIVNELVTNSLKYAYPNGGKKGEIRIELHSNNDSMFNLIVSDSGCGFPEDLDFRDTKTLGCQLVRSLTDQLGGTVEIERDNGTTFSIRFGAPCTAKKSPEPEYPSPKDEDLQTESSQKIEIHKQGVSV